MESREAGTGERTGLAGGLPAGAVEHQQLLEDAPGLLGRLGPLDTERTVLLFQAADAAADLRRGVAAQGVEYAPAALADRAQVGDVADLILDHEGGIEIEHGRDLVERESVEPELVPPEVGTGDCVEDPLRKAGTVTRRDEEAVVLDANGVAIGLASRAEVNGANRKRPPVLADALGHQRDRAGVTAIADDEAVRDEVAVVVEPGVDPGPGLRHAGAMGRLQRPPGRPGQVALCRRQQLHLQAIDRAGRRPEDADGAGGRPSRLPSDSGLDSVRLVNSTAGL